MWLNVSGCHGNIIMEVQTGMRYSVFGDYMCSVNFEVHHMY